MTVDMPGDEIEEKLMKIPKRACNKMFS